MEPQMLQLRRVQANYEMRFSCAVCLSPRWRMVYGNCQHRLCEECLYGDGMVRQKYLERCPTCQQVSSFPEYRVEIPEDNIEMQKLLGVRECTVDGCNTGLWEWELEEHMKSHISQSGGTKRKVDIDDVDSEIEFRQQPQAKRANITNDVLHNMTDTEQQPRVTRQQSQSRVTRQQSPQRVTRRQSQSRVTRQQSPPRLTRQQSPQRVTRQQSQSRVAGHQSLPRNTEQQRLQSRAAGPQSSTRATEPEITVQRTAIVFCVSCLSHCSKRLTVQRPLPEQQSFRSLCSCCQKPKRCTDLQLSIRRDMNGRTSYVLPQIPSCMSEDPSFRVPSPKPPRRLTRQQSRQQLLY